MLQKEAEEFLDFDWPVVKATEYLEIIRSGERNQDKLKNYWPKGVTRVVFTRKNQALKGISKIEIAGVMPRFCLVRTNSNIAF